MSPMSTPITQELLSQNPRPNSTDKSREPLNVIRTNIASALKLMTPDEFTSVPASSATAFAKVVSDP